MTAVAHDDIVKWYWAETVASVSAPTAANITAAALLTGITNYTLSFSEAEVDTSDIDGLYDTAIVGTSKAGPITITQKRDDTDESSGYDLWEFRDTGYLIRSPFGAATASSKVEVYPAQVGQVRPAGYARNTVQMFEVNFYITDEPDTKAVVAA